MRLLDIEQQDAADFAAAFDGCDAVVFAAGGGPDGNIERKRTVDLEGSLKSIEGARLAGIRRFVQVSAINVDDPLPDDTGDVWRAYVEAKRDADAALRESGLDWTIIRPGRLTDEPATGLVALGSGVPRGDDPSCRRRRRAGRRPRQPRHRREAVERRLRRHSGRRRRTRPSRLTNYPPTSQSSASRRSRNRRSASPGASSSAVVYAVRASSDRPSRRRKSPRAAGSR